MSDFVYSNKDIRVLEVTSLLTHPGMKHLKELFKEGLEDEAYKIEKILNGPITSELRDELNFHVQKRNIYRDFYENITDFLKEYLKRKSLDSEKNFNFTESNGA